MKASFIVFLYDQLQSNEVLYTRFFSHPTFALQEQRQIPADLQVGSVAQLVVSEGFILNLYLGTWDDSIH